MPRYRQAIRIIVAGECAILILTCSGSADTYPLIESNLRLQVTG
jgi:hypothetical protein